MVQRPGSWRSGLLCDGRRRTRKATTTTKAYHLAGASTELLHWGLRRPVFVIVLLRVRLILLSMLQNAAIRTEY